MTNIYTLQISDYVQSLGRQAQKTAESQFAHIDEIAEINTQRVLAAFQELRVSESCFRGSTGYGYNDAGRDKLEQIYARIFGTEDALVRIQFVNGTHAITCALFSALMPGDILVSAVGAPYDTLLGVIGVTEDGYGSLKDYGIGYRQVDVLDNLEPDRAGLARAVREPGVRAVLIQRSRGYAQRPSLSVEQIGELIQIVRENNSKAVVIVDNCYGEFVEATEPSHVGADLVVGSLIKNPGGGLAPMGGYIAGKHELVERAAQRLTTPGIGRECGATLGQNRWLYQGLFCSPHVTAQALKTAIFAAQIMRNLGYETDPVPDAIRYDIIQQIALRTPDAVEKFCRGIQKGSPVDSFVTPVPWDMPGYGSQVIMAAGAFIQGASIELSADAPMRPPYTVYLQGGLTYESGKTGILLAVQELLS